jgi:hypothetical protein
MCHRENVDVNGDSPTNPTTLEVDEIKAVVMPTAVADSPDSHKSRPLSSALTASALSEHSPVPPQKATTGTLINEHLAEMTSLLNHALHTASARADDSDRLSSHLDKQLLSGRPSYCFIALLESKSRKKNILANSSLVQEKLVRKNHGDEELVRREYCKR